MLSGAIYALGGGVGVHTQVHARLLGLPYVIARRVDIDVVVARAMHFRKPHCLCHP